MIIGLAGYAGAGKDTIAFRINQLYGGPSLPFADGVRALATTMNLPVPGMGMSSDITYVDLINTYGYEEAKRTFPGVRQQLQAIGEGVRRTLGEDTWIQRAIRRASEWRRCTIPDVRYSNEVDAILAAGGHVFWVHRPGVGPANGHPSENELGRGDKRFAGEFLNDVDTAVDKGIHLDVQIHDAMETLRLHHNY